MTEKQESASAIVDVLARVGAFALGDLSVATCVANPRPINQPSSPAEYGIYAAAVKAFTDDKLIGPVLDRVWSAGTNNIFVSANDLVSFYLYDIRFGQDDPHFIAADFVGRLYAALETSRIPVRLVVAVSGISSTVEYLDQFPEVI